MRILLGLLVLLTTAIGAAWLGGETWLAREAARRIEADPRISAASVTPLREVNRIGLHLTDVAVETPEGQATLPALDLFAAPTSPNEFHADLPPAMTVPLGGTPRQLGTTDGTLSLRVSPGNRMAISRVAAASGPVSLDGAPVAASVQGEAQLTALGAAAPRAARAAYNLSGRIDGLTPPPALTLPPAITAAGPLSVDGEGKLWLDGPVTAGSRPQVVGFGTHGTTVTLGERKARLSGQLSADAEGRAEGALFAYTADPRGWVDLAVSLGAIPQGIAGIAGTALETAARTEPTLPAGVPAPAPPEPGELRIPLIFQGGRTLLGPLPIGRAPEFPR